MSPDQPGSPLLELWGCLGALDKGRMLAEKLLSEGPNCGRGVLFPPIVGRTRRNGMKSSQGLKRTTSVSWVAQSVWLFVTQWTTACQASLSITNSRSLLKLMSIKLIMPSNHLILCPPLLFPPSIFPSLWVFLNESVLRIRWPKYWSFSFSISPSNEYSGLISFRWLKLEEINTSFEGWTFSWRCFTRLETF